MFSFPKQMTWPHFISKKVKEPHFIMCLGGAKLEIVGKQN